MAMELLPLPQRLAKRAVFGPRPSSVFQVSIAQDLMALHRLRPQGGKRTEPQTREEAAGGAEALGGRAGVSPALHPARRAAPGP